MSRVGIGAVVAVAAALGIAALLADERDEPPPGTGWDSGLAQSPFSRSEVGAARLGERIYVVGGFRADGGTTGSMAAYDIAADRWIVRRPLPQPVNHPGAAALGGHVYVVGGQRGRSARATAAVWRYTPARDRWKRLADAPTARGALGLAADGRRLYAVGGAGRESDQLRRLEIYDPQRRRWLRGAPMPTGRNHLAAVFAGGFLWAIGGRREGGENLAAVERYEPGRDRWRRLEPLNVPRSGNAAAAAGEAIYVVGGEDLRPGGTTIGEVERLALGAPERGWELLEPMPSPRHGLGAAATDRFLYALEGGTRPGFTTSRSLERLAIGSR